MSGPTLADCLQALARHYPHLIQFGDTFARFAGGYEYRTISLGYASDPHGMSDDLLRVAHQAGITVTLSQWAVITPLFTAFGSDAHPSTKWRGTAKGAAHAIALMLLDAATHPESPREPSPLEMALIEAEQDIAVLRSRLEEAERRRGQLVSALETGT